jgi:prepilin-type N-terminal cleavage/methylation domain-containing protein
MERTFCQRDTSPAAGLVAGGTDQRTCPQHRSSAEPEAHQNLTANRLNVPTGKQLPQQRSEMRVRENERGFTLVELIIAVVLVSILAAVAVVGLSGVVKSGNKSACSTTLGSAQSAATTYYANTGAYPTTFDALADAVPSVWTYPANVGHAGKVMYQGSISSPTWSVTMAGGGGSTPNTYTNTSGGGAPCS